MKKGKIDIQLLTYVNACRILRPNQFAPYSTITV